MPTERYVHRPTDYWVVGMRLYFPPLIDGHPTPVLWLAGEHNRTVVRFHPHTFAWLHGWADRYAARVDLPATVADGWTYNAAKAMEA